MNKLWIGVVALLLVINSVAIVLLWFKNTHERMPKIIEPVNEYLSKELKLKPKQLKQYDSMRIQHHELTQKLIDESRLMRDTFFAQIKAPMLDSAKINALAQKISGNQQLIESATLYHFRQFRSILNADQQNRFDQVIDNVLHAMERPEPHRPEGPPRPGERAPSLGADPLGPPHAGLPPGN